MKKYFKLFLLTGIILFQFIFNFEAQTNSDQLKPWRGGWAYYNTNIAELMKTAKNLGFNGLMFYIKDDRQTKEICLAAKKENIDIYAWYTPRDKTNKDLWQIISQDETERLQKIKNDKTPGKNGYQFGGEPVNLDGEALTDDLLCFHRPEVAEICKKQLKEILQNYPQLAGIAFDYFGYKNYKCCRCPVSEKMFEAYYKKLLKDSAAKITAEKALEQFSLDTLTAFINSLADYVREVKPGCKTTIHIYPTFLAEPLYGNRLNVDYCLQTVAWYFEPFWSLEKINSYAKTVVNDANRYFPRPQGIPFVGIYMGKPGISKSKDRFREELKVIANTGTQSFSICPFNIFLEHPELGNILLDELGIPKK
ncbi:MAG: hypothetical protein A2096_15595 [Spirochaetes bacterium GWF1_41_5]|nr:MAG: hypothetical protein A2096_15595 [Spirochaetes bacterium GWF1_41_5]HBE00939.1 hypothetical protein [Spirochaetia bacterium]